VYRIILGPAYDNKKDNLRILTNKEIYVTFKKTYRKRQSGYIDYVGLDMYMHREWKKIGFPKEHCT
jgi:hypothetical protein